MITPRRDVLVRVVLVATVSASLGLFAAGGERSELPVAVAPAAAPAAPRPAAKGETLRIDLLRRDAQLHPERDAFAAHSWQPPPPPPPPRPVQAKLEAPEPPPPPPPPAAPPLPFTFLGAFEAAGGKQVFYLVEADRVHAVSQGDTVNDLYSIEAADAEGIVLLYLPLKIRQTLAFEVKK